jgi:aryl-alcohol dehydrogenase
MKISAAVTRSPRQPFVIEDIELDAPRRDEVLVRLVATGICHSDMTLVDQSGPFKLPFPIVLGHEGAGIVEVVGEDVTGLAPGDHVVLTFDSCGHCEPCTAEHPAYCKEFGPLNLTGSRPDGSGTMRDQQGATVHATFLSQSSFATFAITKARNSIKVRKDADLKLLAPMGCGMITGAGTVFNVMKPGPRDTMAILGAGAVGFAALFAAKLCGVSQVVAVDRVADRLGLALELGASDVINTSTSDLTEELARFGPLDYVLDTTGVPAVLEAAVGNLAPQGVCCIAGASTQPTMILSIWNMLPGRVIRGIFEGDCDPQVLIPRLVDHFVDGTFPLDRITRFYDFEDINTAAQDGRSGLVIKPVVVF